MRTVVQFSILPGIFLLLSFCSFAQKTDWVSPIEGIPSDTFSKLIVKNKVKSMMDWDSADTLLLLGHLKFDRQGNEIYRLENSEGTLSKSISEFNAENQLMRTFYYLADTGKIGYHFEFTYDSSGQLAEQKLMFPGNKTGGINRITREGDSTFFTFFLAVDPGTKSIGRIFSPARDLKRIDHIFYEHNRIVQVKTSYMKYDSLGRLTEQQDMDYEEELRQYIVDDPWRIAEITTGFQLWDQILKGKVRGKDPRPLTLVYDEKGRLTEKRNQTFFLGPNNEIVENNEMADLFPSKEEETTGRNNQKFSYNSQNQLIGIQYEYLMPDPDPGSDGDAEVSWDEYMEYPYKREYVYNERGLPVEMFTYDRENELITHRKFAYEYY